MEAGHLHEFLEEHKPSTIAPPKVPTPIVVLGLGLQYMNVEQR